jgi:hypothetical protein
MYIRCRIWICVWFCTFFISTSSCRIISFSGKKITLINTIETRNCYISFVLVDKSRYLVKQKRANNKIIAVVRDALAAFLAKDLKIAHEVDVIHFKKSFPGKINKLWPASIHTIALGETIRQQRDSIYSTLRLRQLWALAKNFEETGITRNIISQMTWHRQLPIIIALDLLIGNSDRHCGNLCYDSKTDTFCAIDMDDTFNKDLCSIACKKLELMMKDPKNNFTIQEINAFIQLRKTIKTILQQYKSSDVVKKLYYFAQRAGFVPGTKLYNPSIKRKLSLYESMIVKTWMSAHKLVGILNKIIDKNIKEVWYVRGYMAENESI